MSTVLQKNNYLIQVQSAMTEVGHLVQRAALLQQMFADRGYDTAATDPITKADLDPFGIVAPNAAENDARYALGVAINLLGQIAALVNNTPLNREIVNRWRQV